MILSNTLDCIRRHPLVSERLDDLSIADFLLFDMIQDPAATSFQDIRRLPAAHTLVFQNGSIAIRRYWELSVKTPVHYKRQAEYVEHFSELLDAAVADRVGAGPAGVLMSGGLDSPTIAASAKRVLVRQGAPGPHCRNQFRDERLGRGINGYQQDLSAGGALSAVHLAYGLQIEVEVPLPGLLPGLEQREPDLHVRLKSSPSSLSAIFDLPANSYYAGSNFDEHGNPALRVATLSHGQYYGFFYADGVRFAVQRSGHEIWGDWPPGYSFEDACTYLVGPVMAFALRLRGVTCLHASAIAVGDRAFVIVGAAGAGKSTTAACFAKMGFPILADDLVALTEYGNCLLVQPGYPRLNLWPDSVRELFGREVALPKITPTWDKCYLKLDQHGDYRYQAEPLPLGGIYFLGEREVDLAAPVFEPASGSTALMFLVANAYGNHFLNDEMRKRDLEVLSRAADQVPVHKVRPPGHASRMYGLCEAIAKNAGSIAQNEVSRTAHL